MQQNGDQRGIELFGSNGYPFGTEVFKGDSHQVHGPDGMVKASMMCPGIYQLGKPQLLDTPEPLEIGMVQDIKDQFASNGYETIYRIIDNLLLVQFCAFMLSYMVLSTL